MRYILTIILILFSLNLNAQVLRANPLYVSSAINEPVPLGIQGTRTTTQIVTSVTDHPINLPAGITPGEMIFVFFSVRYAPTVVINTGVSGNNWTISDLVPYGTDITAAYVYKIAEGGDVLQLTTGDARHSTAISFRIASATTVYSSSSTATTTTPDPASLTPAGGEAEYVWIVANAVAAAKTYSDYPDGYSNGTTVLGVGSSDVSIATVDKLATASSDDPNTFTVSSIGYNATLTIAIK